MKKYIVEVALRMGLILMQSLNFGNFDAGGDKGDADKEKCRIKILGTTTKLKPNLISLYTKIKKFIKPFPP